MRNGNMIGRCGELEQLSTENLDRMLHAELHKEDADPEEVRSILAVLKTREEEAPIEPDAAAQQAWDKYRVRTKVRSTGFFKRGGWLLRVAVAGIVLSVLLVGVSTQAEADVFWNRIARWTDCVIEFFTPGSGGQQDEYVFQTEHPGLQQVYDTVSGLGITQPVVPMWIPEGYGLAGCKEMATKNKTTVVALFRNGEDLINYNLVLYTEGAPNQYQKDEDAVKIFELRDVSHYIVKNNGAWVVVWTKDNIECSVLVDCSEEDLYRILRSIYDKEEST